MSFRSRPTLLLSSLLLVVTLQSGCDKELSAQGTEAPLETGERRGVAPQLAARLRRQLDVLNQARTTADMNLPGYRLHQLKRNRSGTPGVLAVAETGVSRSDLKVKTLSMLTLKIIIKHSKYGEHLAK